MKDRFEKAHADLMRWRGYNRGFHDDKRFDWSLNNSILAVDAAFKSEVLEIRIRLALYDKAWSEVGTNDEAGNRIRDLQATPTGEHLYDFDWWLTEATMRSLHSGVDTLLFLVSRFLDLEPTPQNATQLLKAVRRNADYSGLADAIECGYESDSFKSLQAMVNHIKHSGFPERRVEVFEVYDGPTRWTSVEAFEYKGVQYGDWMPKDVEAIIDGVRSTLLAISAEVVDWVEEPPFINPIQVVDDWLDAP